MLSQCLTSRAANTGVQPRCEPSASMVKAAAAKLGFDPATFGGHSLRSGLATTAVKRGVNLRKVWDQTGHRSLEMLRVHTRDAELFRRQRRGWTALSEEGACI
jgi:integrase